MANKFSATLQAGVAVAINERWYADLSVTKSFLKTTATFSTGQTQNIKLDPLAVCLGVGYKF
jgi:outer membrane protein